MGGWVGGGDPGGSNEVLDIGGGWVGGWVDGWVGETYLLTPIDNEVPPLVVDTLVLLHQLSPSSAG